MEITEMVKKILFLLLVLGAHISAASLEDIWQWYNNKEYHKVCSNSVTATDYFRYNKDENFINMYAHACLETDMINRLARPIIQLRKSKESRANASYYTTILYQKKLLYNALIDNLDILPKNLPSTNYILSKVYDDYVNQKYEKKDGAYLFKDAQDSSYMYKLSIKKDNDGFIKLVLETFKDGTIIKTRMYW